MLQGRQSELDDRFTVVVIPARGGSKGVPRKNLREVNGVPLIARAVRTSLSAWAVSEVFVSTEDYEIQAVAADAGATVVFRPSELAGDASSTRDVIAHALGQMNCRPRIVCLVQCTAPLLTAVQIDGTVNRLIKTGADVAVAAAEFHGFPVRAGYADRVHGIGWEMHHGVCRRQDAERQWVIAGSCWAFRGDYFRRTGRLYSPDNTVIFEVPEKLDIDTPADLELADLILRQRENPPVPGGPDCKTKRAELGEIYYPH